MKSCTQALGGAEEAGGSGKSLWAKWLSEKEFAPKYAAPLVRLRRIEVVEAQTPA